ncbi:hypothetical protein [Bradyrhizobium cenepequi]|uniref:hypothetical protein n=1 Tax=Bradyrhizobium cenepequi TaxID=2821403 RepID=UPI001CE368A0|nr:hypothetical protein [Bradyrhizobium cenepequi]MCA6111550.1 hypothetical protein [Bradyrhizobium cenepequi]
MPLKDPDAVAAIVSTLRRVHGDNIARALLKDGVSLAALIDAAFRLPISNGNAVRMIGRALRSGDFSFTPDMGPLWHVRYIYEDRRASMRVVDMEMSTPDRTFSSAEISLRLSA